VKQPRTHVDPVHDEPHRPTPRTLSSCFLLPLEGDEVRPDMADILTSRQWRGNACGRVYGRYAGRDFGVLVNLWASDAAVRVVTARGQ